MNTEIFYVTISVCALAGLCFLWQLGFQRLFLDEFRDSAFIVRDELYLLVQQGRISADAPAYRAVESLINSLIRYAHRFTFTYLVLSSTELRKREADGEPELFATRLMQSIEAVSDREVRESLQKMTIKVSFLLARYMARSSLFFIALSATTRVIAPLVSSRKKKHAIQTFESEAYKTYEADRYTGALAA